MKPILECKGLSKKYNKKCLRSPQSEPDTEPWSDHRTAWSKR